MSSPPASSSVPPSSGGTSPPAQRRSSRRHSSSSSSALPPAPPDSVLGADPPAILPLALLGHLTALQTPPALVASISEVLLQHNLDDPDTLAQLSRPDVDLLFPGEALLASRLKVLALASRCRTVEPAPLPDPLPHPDPVVTRFDLAAAFTARGLVGLDSRLLPPAHIFDHLTKPGTDPLSAVLDLPLLKFLPPQESSVTPVATSSPSSGSRDPTVDLFRSNLKPGGFNLALLSWALTALLTSEISLASVFGHVQACNRVLEHHGILTARLYDEARRRGMALDVRAGIHPGAAGLTCSDPATVADCKHLVDRALASRSSFSSRDNRPPPFRSRGRPVSSPYESRPRASPASTTSTGRPPSSSPPDKPSSSSGSHSVRS